MGKIKFIHMSDTHIGLNRWSKTTDNGHNARGEDFLNSFKISVEEACKLNPDFILHAGDLFESVVVADRYIYEVQKILSKVTCPMIIVAGNHDTPKTKSAINPILLLDVMPNIKIVANDYEMIELQLKDSIVEIHAIPHIIDVEKFTDTLKGIKPEHNTNYKIAVTHGARPFGNYKYSEEGHMIPDEFIYMSFDYIALGDYHLAKEIHRRCFYSGGTDVFRSSELSEKCFLVVSMDGIADQTEEIDVQKHEIPVRKCHRAKLSCADKGVEDIYISLEKYVAKIGDDMKDSVVYLELFDVDSLIRDGLSRIHIKKIFSECFYVQEKISTINKETGETEETTSLIGSVLVEWRVFSKDKKEISTLGEGYLNAVAESKS